MQSSLYSIIYIYYEYSIYTLCLCLNIQEYFVMLIYACMGLYEYLLIYSTLHGMYVECYIECCNAFTH